jgi:hypothetical protein
MATQLPSAPMGGAGAGRGWTWLDPQPQAFQRLPTHTQGLGHGWGHGTVIWELRSHNCWAPKSIACACTRPKKQFYGRTFQKKYSYHNLAGILVYHCISVYTIWVFNSLPWKDPPYLIGSPSINRPSIPRLC